MDQLSPGVVRAAESSGGGSIEQIGLAGAGAAVVVLALRWMTGLVSRDNEERVALRAELGALRVDLVGVRAECHATREAMIKCDVERAALERRVAELETRKD